MIGQTEFSITPQCIVVEQIPCFQLGFDFLNVENSDDFEESSAEVACNVIKHIFT